MTPRERVLATIAHREPDRVPVGEWGIDHDHVSAVLGRHTYWRNRKDTTIALWEGRRDEVVDSLKEDYSELVRALEYDLVTVELVPPKGYRDPDPPRRVADGIWEDSRGAVYKYAASNDSIVRADSPPGKEELTDEDVEAATKAAAEVDESRFELIDHIVEQFGGERAILGRGLDIYGALVGPFGGDMSHQLMLSHTSPDEIRKLYPAALAKNRAILAGYANHGVDIAMQGHDFGMNSGCIMRPQVIRDLFFPLQRMVVEESERVGIPVFFHCCGRIWDILDDFVAAGYKGYQSIQESAGMSTVEMKKRYGDVLTLWTGVQCETLIEATVQETEAEVKRSLEILMPGGGFIFGSTNSVQYGAQTENYLRALETVRRSGQYRM
jgi:uroporphyrinogen decarboxylase